MAIQHGVLPGRGPIPFVNIFFIVLDLCLSNTFYQVRPTRCHLFLHFTPLIKVDISVKCANAVIIKYNNAPQSRLYICSF